MCLSNYVIPKADTFFFYSNHNRPTDNHVRRFLERHGIPYHYLPTTPGNKREQEILELIEGTDFVVLARYMQVNIFRHNVLFPFLLLSSKECGDGKKRE